MYRPHPPRRTARTLAAALMLALLLAACGGGGDDAAEDDSPEVTETADTAADTATPDADSDTGATEAPATEEPTDDGEGTESADAAGGEFIADRPVPTDETPEEEVQIAMIGFSNNPYWVVVQSGVEAANEVLAERNGSVEWIVAGANIDVATVDSAIRAAAAQGYDGIGFFIAGEGNCQAIEDLTAEGLVLGAYNTQLECVEEAGGIINYAQAQYEAGQRAAEEMIAMTGGEGTVGIITSQFTAPGAEQRRTGFIDGLEGSGLTPVNEGVEARDSASDTFSAAQNFIQSNDDLVGIYATAGGPFGAAQAVEEAGLSEDITVIGFDITPENLEVLRDGSMDALIGQDAFGQGYNVAIELYNAAVTGEGPDEVIQDAFSPVVTRDNLDQYDPEQNPVGTLGTS
ncbi:sugar ABC transporter substrate-binding protein [Euzebya sp.]|uniref:sugar ABC transporter substrate-binding protein n=1 Tax=Euzebya sp. TaxID=1971409 RepID=UPI0035178436